MLHLVTCLAAAAALSLPLLASPCFSAVSDDCNNETWKYAFDAGGRIFEFKVTCKGSWDVFASVGFSPFVSVSATEKDIARSCKGEMATPFGAGDVRRYKVECNFNAKHKVKMEVKEK